jgi:hypothetical protein
MESAENIIFLVACSLGCGLGWIAFLPHHHHHLFPVAAVGLL